MKNNYHQTFIVVCLMIYIHVRFSMKIFAELQKTTKHLLSFEY